MISDDKDLVPGSDWARIARTVGVLGVVLSFLYFLTLLFILLATLGSASPGPEMQLRHDLFGVFVYTLGLLAGTIIAYSRERAGGIIFIAMSVAVMIWIYPTSSSPFLDMLLIGGLPLLVGTLFLVSDRRK